MIGQRFEKWNDNSCKVKDNQENILLSWEDVVQKLNEQQANIDKLEQENADLLGDNIRSLDEFEKCTNKLKKKILEQQATIESLKKENQSLIENIFDIYEKVKWVSR